MKKPRINWLTLLMGGVLFLACLSIILMLLVPSDSLVPNLVYKGF